jgi:hypothetical protein
MARRSPMNERYKKDAKIGSTRKSAASAKPKRELGESAKAAAPSQKPAPSKGRILLPNPDTPEFKRWNMINYVALGAALAAAVGVLFVQQQARTPGAMVMGVVPANVVVGVIWAIWGVSLAASMYIQFAILRKMRMEWEASGQAAAKAKENTKAKAAREAEKDAAKSGKGDGEDGTT